MTGQTDRHTVKHSGVGVPLVSVNDCPLAATSEEASDIATCRVSRDTTPIKPE